MFGSKKTITDRVKDVLTEYLDDKFEDYRGQISLDLARGLASLAGLVAIWTLAIVCVVFVSIAFALLLGWALSFWMSSFAFVLSFLIVAVILLCSAFIILLNKEKLIEEPVFTIMAKTLRSPETWGLEDKKKDTPKDTKKTKPKDTSTKTKEAPKPKENKKPSGPELELPPHKIDESNEKETE